MGMKKRIDDVGTWLVLAAGGFLIFRLLIDRGLIFIAMGAIGIGLVGFALWWDTSRRRRKRQRQRRCYPSRWWEGVELPTFLQNR